jgi:hypothetical protein
MRIRKIARICKIAWVGGLLAALPLVALAAALPEPAGPQSPVGGRGACRADVQRLCGDVQPGNGARRQCLRQHRSELSAQCQERIGQVRQRVAQLRQACGGDVQRLCSGVQPGHGAIRSCIREHANELSPTCRGTLPQGGGAR